MIKVENVEDVPRGEKYIFLRMDGTEIYAQIRCNHYWKDLMTPFMEQEIRIGQAVGNLEKHLTNHQEIEEQLLVIQQEYKINHLVIGEGETYPLQTLDWKRMNSSNQHA